LSRVLIFSSDFPILSSICHVVFDPASAFLLFCPSPGFWICCTYVDSPPIPKTLPHSRFHVPLFFRRLQIALFFWQPPARAWVIRSVEPSRNFPPILTCPSLRWGPPTCLANCTDSVVFVPCSLDVCMCTNVLIVNFFFFPPHPYAAPIFESLYRTRPFLNESRKFPIISP